MKFVKFINELQNKQMSVMRCKHYAAIISGNKIIYSSVNYHGNHAEISALKRYPKDR